MSVQLNSNSGLVTTSLQEYLNNKKYIKCMKSEATETNTDWGNMQVTNLVRHIGWGSTSIRLEFNHSIDADKVPFESQRLYIIGPYTDTEKRLTSFKISHNENGPPTDVLTIPVIGMDNDPNNILGVIDIVVSDDGNSVKFKSLPVNEGDTSNISESITKTVVCSIPILTVATGKYSEIIPMEMSAIAVKKLTNEERVTSVASVDVDDSQTTSGDTDIAELYADIKSELDAMTVVVSKSNSSIQQLSSKLESIYDSMGKSEMEIQASGRYEALSSRINQISNDIDALGDKDNTASIDTLNVLVRNIETIVMENKAICTSLSQAIDKLTIDIANANKDDVTTKSDSKGNGLLYCITAVTGLQLILTLFKKTNKG